MVHTWKGTTGNDTKFAHKTYFGTYWETWKMYGDRGDDTLKGGKKSDFIYGGSGNDSLYGGEGNDLLSGGFGLDKMWGGKGDDTYIVGDSLDKVYESYNEGYDTVQSSRDFTLGNYVERLELVGAATRGAGSAQDNDIFGNTVSNSLYGYAGDDDLYGRDGNDFLDGGSGNDRLYGENGNDTLVGGSGNDTMVGGIGNDTYYVADVGDRISESRYGGIDTVKSSLFHYSLENASYAENLDLHGKHSYRGTGNAFNNTLTGNNNNNRLYGKEGSDVLVGGAGNDHLVGGVAGTNNYSVEFDKLTGGSGADTFVLGDWLVERQPNRSGVFYQGRDYAHITDFSRTEGDKLLVVGNQSDYTLNASNNVLGSSSRDTQVFYRGDLIAVVEDVSNLSTASDFVFQ